MESENLLFVEDDESWRARIQKTLKGNKVFNIVSTIEEAKAAIESGAVTRIITDGLEGDWEQLMALAQTAGIPLKVISGNIDVLEKAKSMGTEAVDKKDISIGTVEIENL